MTSSNNTKQAEGLRSFCKSLGRVFAEAGKEMATNLKKIRAELWKILQTLLLQPQLKTLKQLFHH